MGETMRRAANLCGYLSAGQLLSDNDKSQARAFLEMIVGDLGAESITARFIEFFNLALAGDSLTFEYDLPSEYFDVMGDGMYIAAGQDLDRAQGETPVQQISRERWQSLSTKNAAMARPTMFYLNRENDVLQVRLWGIPSEAGHIRFQAQRTLAGCDDDKVTIDLEQYWTGYLLWELAGHIASAKSMTAQAGGCFAKAESKRKKALGKATQHPPLQIILEHRTGGMR